MTLPAIHQPEGARHSTSLIATSYMGESGRLAFNPLRRGEVHQTVRQWLRVARSPEEIHRVMEIWRRVHYLAKPEKGPRYDPIGREQIRIHYYLDLPALRSTPVPWYPAAAVTVRFVLPNGVPRELGLGRTMQTIEIARNFLCDDLRYPAVPDLAPEILREVVRRIRRGDEWAGVVRGRVRWQPQWLLTFSDPGVGHDGGLYRGAGAVYLGERTGGKQVWGWPLSQEAREKVGM